MIRSLLLSSLFVVALGSCRTTSDVSLTKDDESAKSEQKASSLASNESIRDMVIFNHFDQQKLQGRTIGLEVEVGGMDPRRAIDVLVKSLGGTFAGEINSGTEAAYLIKGTSIGDVRIEPVNLRRILNRVNETNPNVVTKSQLLGKTVDGVDKVVGTFEVITEPLSYEKTQKFALAMDALGLAGAKGTSNAGRLVSFQVNNGIDHTNPEVIKNLLRNYYSNKAAIRGDIAPAALRKMYLGSISNEFIKKLNDPNWKPSISELFDWYVKHSPPKLARLNLFNALVMNPENAGRVKQSTSGAKEIVGRPVVEHREANTVMSTPKDPHAASRHIMYNIDWSLAFQIASEEGVEISVEKEYQRMETNLSLKDQKVRAKPQNFKEILSEKYHSEIQTRKVEGSKLLLGNQELLGKWGFKGGRASEARFLSSFGIEVNPDARAPPAGKFNPNAPYATAHKDGAGGQGDGRAMSVQEHNGHVVNLKGIGLTPYVLKNYSTMLGFHIGGVDGKASYEEGIRSYIVGELLNSIGVQSERVVGLIDNNKTADGGFEGVNKSAIIVRELPGGGIRNSHVMTWDRPQLRKGLDYMKNIASGETGRRFTDTSFVVFDAQRSAQIAARLQTHYVVHGALTRGNILAYPGVVDLNTVKFLSVPDPQYTPIAQRSRFGAQTDRLLELVQERVKAYAKLNPRLKKVQIKEVFEQAYRRELGILGLQRLGIDRVAAERTYTKNPAKVDAYTKSLWQKQFGRLYSNLNEIQNQTAQKYERIKGKEAGIAEKVAADVSDPNREIMKARRGWMQSAVNKLQRNYRAITGAETGQLLNMGVELIDLARNEARAPGGRFMSNQEYIGQVKSNASAFSKMTFPDSAAVSKLVDAGSAHDAGSPEALRQIDQEITDRKELGRRLQFQNNCESVSQNMSAIGI